MQLFVFSSGFSWLLFRLNPNNCNIHSAGLLLINLQAKGFHFSLDETCPCFCQGLNTIASLIEQFVFRGLWTSSATMMWPEAKVTGTESKRSHWVNNFVIGLAPLFPVLIASLFLSFSLLFHVTLVTQGRRTISFVNYSARFEISNKLEPPKVRIY